MTEQKKRKRGPWSKAEKDFIAAHAAEMSVEEISLELDREPDAINKYIRTTLGLRIKKENKSAVLSSGTDIENTLIWKELEQEFTKEELNTFIYHWNRIIVQFKEDVFPTEEMQIIDAIKLEIMMGRSAKIQKENIQQIRDIQSEILKLKSMIDPPMDGTLEILEKNLIAHKSAYSLADKEFNDLLQRKSAILKELKGTRDQRLKRIEDSKTTFNGWMAQLLNDTTMRKDLGIYIEKIRLAMNLEEKRLTVPFQYTETEVDLPILNDKVLARLEEEEKEKE